MKPSRHIVAAARVEGLHHWPDAPAPESYLRQSHRHLFVVTIRLQVFHEDREIEINAFTRWLQSELLPSLAITPADSGPADFGSQSCEQLAERVCERVRTQHGSSRWMECEVLEDGILGGGVRWPG